ncbi:MAG TPA: hypothetical protein VMV81_11360 [Phycisphaerae bacterium]|nr:hypothetical protein [Phycisphaerae bacterium]
MPTQQVQHIVKHHRPALIGGIIAGVLLIGGFVAYQVVATPPTPIVQKAAPAEMVEFVANKRGLAKLADIQQKQFFEDWKRKLEDKQARDDLKAYLKNLDDERREAFVNALAGHFKKNFIDDARKFAQLRTPGEKNEFVRAKLIEGRDQAIQFKDIAISLKTGGGRRTDDIQQWIMDNTTAEERAIGEPFVDAMKRVREQMKKEERGTTTASAVKKP